MEAKLLHVYQVNEDWLITILNSLESQLCCLAGKGKQDFFFNFKVVM
jgi:hypothetical protein